jgi:hypothetical protein
MGLCVFNDEILQNRNKYDKVIHLVGDSISRGYGLGTFSDQVPTDHPVYLLRSIASMANSVLVNSKLHHRFAYTEIDSISPQSMRDRIATGIVRAGDFVIVEDAGHHGNDPVAYEEKMFNMRAAIADKHNISAVFMSMFDYLPNGPPDYQYDTPFDGVTMNDAIINAAHRPADFRGQTLYLDMNMQMDNLVVNAQFFDQLPVILDGIHPNVWGQLLMVGEYIKIAGLRPYLTSASSLYDTIYNNISYLTYGSPTFNATRAIDYANSCVYR